MKKTCLNCVRAVPIYNGGNIVRRSCLLNPKLSVNGQMHCEVWVSNDIIEERHCRPEVLE